MSKTIRHALHPAAQPDRSCPKARWRPCSRPKAGPGSDERMRNFSVRARSSRSRRACATSSCSLRVSSGRRSSGAAASPKAVFSSSTNDTAAPTCSHSVWQAVQFSRKPVSALGHGGDGRHGVFPSAGRPGQSQAEQIAAEVDVAVEVDVLIGRALADQLGTLGSQQLAGPVVGEAGKPIPEGKPPGFLNFRSPCLGLHDRKLLGWSIPCTRRPNCRSIVTISCRPVKRRRGGARPRNPGNPRVKTATSTLRLARHEPRRAPRRCFPPQTRG